jgi:hypothetical protein
MPPLSTIGQVKERPEMIPALRCSMTRLLVLTVTILLWSANAARSQQDGPDPRSGWETGLQLLWLGVGGYDARHGDIVNDSMAVGTGSNFTNGQQRVPIQSPLDSRLTVRGELEYRQGAWGAGIGGWWLDTSSGTQGHVESPPPSGNSFFTSFVLMFEDGRGPVTNQNEPSGNSPYNYFASDRLRTWTIDLYGLYNLAAGGRSWIDLAFGAKLGQLDSRQVSGQTQHAFLFFDQVLLTPPFDNQISLTSTASSNFFGAGPLLGLRGGAQWDRLGLRWSATQSVLVGSACLHGLFTDIDNVGSSPVIPDLGYLGPGVIRSDITYASSKTAFIPVSEAQLKLCYNLTPNLGIGIGGFASIWWNTPIAPIWVRFDVSRSAAPRSPVWVG